MSDTIRCPKCNHPVKDIEQVSMNYLPLNDYLDRTDMEGEVMIKPCGHQVPYNEIGVEDHFV